MMSICKTLETIDFCCYRDAYSDAYNLLRKCRDDLMQYLFVLNVIQNKHGLTDEEAEKFTINSESMMKMIELDVSILVSGERKTDAELAMEKWIYNVLESSENKEDRKKFFDTEYSCAVTPQIRQAGNRLSGFAETTYASLLA